MKQYNRFKVVAGGLVISLYIMGMKEASFPPESIQSKEELGKLVRVFVNDSPLDLNDIKQAFGAVINFKKAHPSVDVDDYVQYIDKYGVKKLYGDKDVDPRQLFFNDLAGSLDQRTVNEIKKLYQKLDQEQAAYHY